MFYEKPCFLLTHVKKELGEFWENISKKPLMLYGHRIFKHRGNLSNGRENRSLHRSICTFIRQIFTFVICTILYQAHLLRKIEFWTWIAYVINLTIYRFILSFMFDLTFARIFSWRICDLINIYYLCVEDWPCNIRMEIFGKLRVCCWVWPNFCWGYFGELFVTFLAKIKTTVL